MMRLFVIILALLSISKTVLAQELNCKVTVQAPQLQIVDPKVFKTLEQSIFEFMNNRSWTDDVFRQEERIDCDLFLSITEEVSANQFKMQAIIKSSRPVYNSDYLTSNFEYTDNTWNIRYNQYDELEFSETTYLSELTALLAYYAYMIIGMDYDTFSELGGTPYFQKAQAIVNMAQSNGISSDWKASEGLTNRYWLVDHHLDNRFQSYRKANYDYHRKGLDKMYDDSAQGRKSVVAAITSIEKLNRQFPARIIPVNVFINYKSDEFVQIFSDGQVPAPEKTKMVNLLSQLAPARSNIFQSINSRSGGLGGRDLREIQKNRGGTRERN